MTSMVERRSLLAALIALTLLGSSWAQSPQRGKNKVTVRGQEQDVYFIPGAGAGPHRKVLFAPGDGGWRGFAITMGEQMAAAGYDVFGVDTRRYLTSFTGSTVLTTSEIAADFRTLAQWAAQGSRERVLLVGWSEGAGLGLAALADGANREVFAGMVSVGTTPLNILAWHWRDVAAEITKSMPNEPTFKSADYISRVSPLPLAVIASTGDEYASMEVTRQLSAAAGDPKKLVVVDASDHKFGGKNNEFFAALRDSLTWIQQQHR